MNDLQAVGDAYARLHPQLFYRRVWEQVRGGLPSSSLGADGGRSAEKPMPRLDRTDLNMLAMRDRYKAHIATSFMLTRAAKFGPAVVQLEHARVIETAVLPELHMSTKAWIEHRKELARQADEEASLRNMRAVKCKNPAHADAGKERWVERTKDDPLCGGRCYDCYVVWKRTGADPTVAQIVALAEKREGREVAV